MKRNMLALLCCMLFIPNLVFGYTTYDLDTTDNGGTGFGNVTAASATGYTSSTFLSEHVLQANACAVQPDGKIVVVGYQSDTSPQTAVVARYNINGTLDTTFGSSNGYVTVFDTSPYTFSSGNNVVLTDVAVQPNGAIVIIGHATPTGGGAQSLLIARLTPVGLADTTFNNTGTQGYVSLNLGDYIDSDEDTPSTDSSTDAPTAVAIDGYGYIYVTGTTTITQGSDGGTTTQDIFAIQFNSLGDLQTSFNPDGLVGGSNSDYLESTAGLALISISSSITLTGNGMRLDPSGNLVIVGSSTNSGVTQMFVARMLNTGLLDTANFNTGNTPGFLFINILSPTIGYDVGFQSTNQNNRIIVSGAAGPDSSSAIAVGVTSTGVYDSTFGQLGNAGYYANGWGGTGVAYSIAVQSDDVIVLGGASDLGFVINAVSANGQSSVLLTSTQISAPSVGRGMAMQQNGSLVLAGTVGTGNTQIGIARYLGVPVEGAMNLYYNPSTSNPGYCVYPTTSVMSDEPQVVAMYPITAGGFYVLTSNPGEGNAQLNVVNAAGSVGTLVPLSFVLSNDVIADSDGRAIVVGATGDPQGFIARYTNVANVMTFDTTFAGGAVYESNASSFVRVAQQSNGNYVAIGQLGAPTTDAILTSYTTTGTRVIYAYIQDAQFYDLVIDDDNNIYVGYFNNATSGVGNGNICVVKYLSTGSVDTSFGTNGIVDTGLLAGLFTAPCLSFDNVGNVVMATVCLDNDDMYFQGYAPTDGTLVASGAINRDTSLVVYPAITKLQCDTYGTYGRLMYAGYDTHNFIVGRLVRVPGMADDPDYYEIDTTFAPYSTCPSILKTNYNDNNPSRVANTVCISTDGALLFGGYENIDGSNTVSVVGQGINAITESPVPTQVNRFPSGSSSADGTLVEGTPFDLGDSASLEGQPQAVYTFGTGTFNGYTLVVTTDGTTAILSMLDATTYELNTNDDETMFANGNGYVTLNDLVYATSIFVAVDGSIYVLGTDNTIQANVKIVRVSADGTTQQSIIPIVGTSGDVGIPALDYAYQIVQQASGRILICGHTSLEGLYSGTIVAINPDDVDPVTSFVYPDISFAPNSWIPGIFILEPGPAPIMSIAVGETSNEFGDADMIYMVSAYEVTSGEDVGLYARVARILENGTQFDPYFDAVSDVSNLIGGVTDALQMRMQINAVSSEGSYGYVNVVANTETGIQAARYNRNDGSLDVDPFVVIPSIVTPTPTLQQLLCLSDGTTLILSSNGATVGTLDLARLTSDFAADPTFNAGGTYTGVLSTTVPASTPTQAQFWAMDVLGNDAAGIIVASDDNAYAPDATPYLTQVVNSPAVTKYPQTASSTPAAGIVDETFNAAGTVPGSLNLAYELSNAAGYDYGINFPQDVIVTSLLQVQEETPIDLPNGWYFIGGSDGVNSYVALMSDDDVLQVDSDFGLAGLLTIDNLYGLSDMIIAQDGTLLIVGTGVIAGASTTGWLIGCNSSTGDFTFYGASEYISHFAIAQQTDGRILVAGDYEGVGRIVAYDSVNGAIDTTFADNGIFTLTGYSSINSILVDADDNVYLIANSSANYAYLISMNSTCTNRNWISQQITGSSSVAENNYITFNQAGNIVAVAANLTSFGSKSIVVKSYNPSTGALVTTLSGGITGVGTPNITSVSVDLNTSPGKVVITGYNSASDPVIPFVIRTNAAETSLDLGFGTSGIVTTYEFGEFDMVAWYAAMINLNGKITVGGFAEWTEDPGNAPYLVRFYGDEFIGQYNPLVIAGTPGTINFNFPDDSPESPNAGYLTLDVETTGTPVCVVPLANGSQYVGFSDGTIVRYTNANILDSDFGPDEDGYAYSTPNGLQHMIIDGNGCLVVVGTLQDVDGGSNRGWIVRYANDNSGEYDYSFNNGNILFIENCLAANKVLEQSLARLIVVGQLANDFAAGALFALTDIGQPDATFSIYQDSGVGVADSGIPLPLYACVADQYDRLLVAGVINPDGYLGISRLTSSAEYDDSFGDHEAIIFNALPDPVDYDAIENLAQIHLVLDSNNNVVIAANTVAGIEIVAYENSTDVTDPSIGVFSFGGMDPLLTSPVLTGMVATEDGKILLCGYQQDTDGSMWVARLVDQAVEDTVVYALDTTFAPHATVPGIMFCNFNDDLCFLAPIAIYGTGEITMVGYDTNPASPVQFMSRAYNNPYVPAVPTCLASLPEGTVDQTFGVTNNDDNNGIAFWAYDDDYGNQSAKAIGLYDDDNLVVALDGTRGETGNEIYINMFNVDGLLAEGSYPDEPYQELVLNEYDNQYVDDMVVFTTVDNVTKAILAGYARNNTPYLTSSLLLCYNLDETELDESFGGYNGTIPGVAFGDVRKLHAVGLQSNGRIIAGGTDYFHNGVVVGYTSMGKMDQSFGQGGAFLQGECGIHATIIDEQDRIVIAYNNAGTPNYLAIARILPDGSALDASFGVDGVLTTSMQLADGNRKNFGIAFDTDGNIVVAAGNATDDGLNLAMYNASGIIVGTVASITGMSLTDYTITQVLVDTSDAVVVVGYDNTDDEYDDKIVVARFVYGDLVYVFDWTFNSPAGFVKYAVSGSSEQSSYKAMIHPDGRVIVTGNQSGVV